MNKIMDTKRRIILNTKNRTITTTPMMTTPTTITQKRIMKNRMPIISTITKSPNSSGSYSSVVSTIRQQKTLLGLISTNGEKLWTALWWETRKARDHVVLGLLHTANHQWLTRRRPPDLIKSTDAKSNPKELFPERYHSFVFHSIQC